MANNPEQLRLSEPWDEANPHWRKWGPFVSERAWGTVREDYSPHGDAWTYFPFEDAHHKAYRWGEDGIAGWCDRYQIIAFAPAFWNGKDPILKERLYGLTSPQGNHGEDVKEYYYHLDGIPSHAYMKYLYKYPQKAFPYALLKGNNANRGSHEAEYELVDTDVFAENRYFDIFVEYAKVDSEDVCIRIEAINRGPDSAPLHLIPQLWFRNQWAWKATKLPEPEITVASHVDSLIVLTASDEKMPSPAKLPFDYHIGKRFLYAQGGGRPLFTNNENKSNDTHAFSKDGIQRNIIYGEEGVNPERKGTKAAIQYVFDAIPAGGSAVVNLRLSPRQLDNPLDGIDTLIAQRKQEADSFYQAIYPKNASAEECSIQRQAFAGLLWSKQCYLFDVNLWLDGDNPAIPPPASRTKIRNIHWRHLNSMRILSIPDKWEYPWFAAWDLSFHCMTMGLIDIAFAKEQLWLLLFDQFQHPNGEIPAYEWEFSDLNPPVQAWAAYRLYQMEKAQRGVEDRAFLKKCFLKLLINFAFWVNKVDTSNNNVFEGGFLGLDNISLVDRSLDIGEGAALKQSDGTAWMAMFCLNLMRIALELAKEDSTYEAMATKFFQHFVYIADAMRNMGNKKFALWSDQDGFFYDALVFPDGHFARFKVRSLVGLIPLFVIDIIETDELEQFPEFKKNFLWFLKNRQNLTQGCVIPVRGEKKSHYVLTLVTEGPLRSILNYVWNPEEFLSPYGIRSLSKIHGVNPFFYKNMQVSYEPGESITRIKGGNSNWRGPIWFPTNFLLIESLMTFAQAFPFTSKGEATPVGRMAQELSERLIALFKKNAEGIRPFFGSFPLAKDPHFQDYLFFHEYFHGETGKGLGASHQTGWTALVANLIDSIRS